MPTRSTPSAHISAQWEGRPPEFGGPCGREPLPAQVLKRVRGLRTYYTLIKELWIRAFVTPSGLCQSRLSTLSAPFLASPIHFAHTPSPQRGRGDKEVMGEQGGA